MYNYKYSIISNIPLKQAFCHDIYAYNVLPHSSAEYAISCSLLVTFIIYSNENKHYSSSYVTVKRLVTKYLYIFVQEACICIGMYFWIVLSCMFVFRYLFNI